MKPQRKPRIKKLLRKGSQPRKIETAEQARNIAKRITSRTKDPKKQFELLEACLKNTTSEEARRCLSQTIEGIKIHAFNLQTGQMMSEFAKMMEGQGKEKSGGTRKYLDRGE